MSVNMTYPTCLSKFTLFSITIVLVMFRTSILNAHENFSLASKSVKLAHWPKECPLPPHSLQVNLVELDLKFWSVSIDSLFSLTDLGGLLSAEEGLP